MINLENIECEKCRKQMKDGVVIGRMNDMWLCGYCIRDLHEKVKEAKKEMFLKE